MPLIFYYGECKLVKTIEVIYGFIINETPPQLGGGRRGRARGVEGRRGRGRVEGKA